MVLHLGSLMRLPYRTRGEVKQRPLARNPAAPQCALRGWNRALPCYDSPAAGTTSAGAERDQQEWIPVLRPIALLNQDWRMA